MSYVEIGPRTTAGQRTIFLRSAENSSKETIISVIFRTTALRQC